MIDTTVARFTVSATNYSGTRWELEASTIYVDADSAGEAVATFVAALRGCHAQTTASE